LDCSSRFSLAGGSSCNQYLGAGGPRFKSARLDYWVRIKTGGCSHSEEWNVIVPYFPVERSYRNAESIGQFFDRVITATFSLKLL
jgi:hypothetical protein